MRNQFFLVSVFICFAVILFSGCLDQISAEKMNTSFGPANQSANVNPWKYWIDSTPLPSITNVSPGSGPTSGGTSVTISGTNLSGVSKVYIGKSAASSFRIVSNTTLTAITPPSRSEKVGISVYTPVINSGGSMNVGAGIGEGFEYIGPPPPIVIRTLPSGEINTNTTKSDPFIGRWSYDRSSPPYTGELFTMTVYSQGNISSWHGDIISETIPGVWEKMGEYTYLIQWFDFMHSSEIITYDNQTDKIIDDSLSMYRRVRSMNNS